METQIMNKFNILRTSTLILSTLIIAACEGGEGSGGDSPATKSGAFALSASSNLIAQNSDNLPIEINYQPTDTSKESAINAVGIPNDSQCTLTLSQAKLKNLTLLIFQSQLTKPQTLNIIFQQLLLLIILYLQVI